MWEKVPRLFSVFFGSKHQPVLLVQFKTFTSTSVGVLDPQDQIEVLVKVIVLCIKCTRHLQCCRQCRTAIRSQLLSVIVTASLQNSCEPLESVYISGPTGPEPLLCNDAIVLRRMSCCTFCRTCQLCQHGSTDVPRIALKSQNYFLYAQIG